MRRFEGIAPLLVLVLVLGLASAGCAQQAFQQQPLASDLRPPSRPTNASLVLGAQSDAEAAALNRRNDALAGVRSQPVEVYYGPGGHLYYSDGTAVQFQGVRKQLETLRAEERINPVNR